MKGLKLFLHTHWTLLPPNIYQMPSPTPTPYHRQSKLWYNHILLMDFVFHNSQDDNQADNSLLHALLKEGPFCPQPSCLLVVICPFLDIPVQL